MCIGIVAFMASALYADHSLDGLRFCRDGTVFGNIPELRYHYIYFKDGKVSDDGPTFGGKQTVIAEYTVKGDLLTFPGQPTEYKFNDKGEITTPAFPNESVLTECGSAYYFEGEMFCRTFEERSSFMPDYDMEHCVSFTESELTDTAPAFYGKPPTVYKYQFDRMKIADKNAPAGSVDYEIIDNYRIKKFGTNQVLTRVHVEGEEFCRTLPGKSSSDPSGTFKHCVSFHQGVVYDNARVYTTVGGAEQYYRYQKMGLKLKDYNYRDLFTILGQNTIATLIESSPVLRRVSIA